MRIAIPAGRLHSQSIAWLRTMGWDLAGEERTLRLADRAQDREAVAVRPGDIPWLVAQGVVEFGLVGEDVLGEVAEEAPLLLGPRLGFGVCRLVVAGTQGAPWPPRQPFRLATKYPRQAEAFLRRLGLEGEIVVFKGSVEVAPHLGVADYILDLVETGNTLRANNLCELYLVSDVEVVLIGAPQALLSPDGEAFWEEVSARAGVTSRG